MIPIELIILVVIVTVILGVFVFSLIALVWTAIGALRAYTRWRDER